MAVGPQLRAILDRYGLGSMAQWASDQLISGASEAEVVLQLYDRPEFQRMFPEIEARRKLAEQTGMNMEPISADQILTYRAQARAMMRSLGLPSNFYSNDKDFMNLIVHDVSMDELSARMDLVVSRVRRAPAEVMTMFDEITAGNGEQALFALFTDPAKSLPYLEDLVQEAEAGGAARRFGFNLSAQQRQRIADININYGQAAEGFAELDVRSGLFDESIFEEVDYTAEEEGTAAIFGLEAGAEEKLQRRAETRVAQTGGRTGGLLEERGATGLGGAGRR